MNEFKFEFAALDFVGRSGMCRFWLNKCQQKTSSPNSVELYC